VDTREGMRMEEDDKVTAYLREAEDLAVKIAHDQITIDEYTETVEALKANVPKDCVIEVEVVFQLAAFKMEHEQV
jgi:hypothetical protein